MRQGFFAYLRGPWTAYGAQSINPKKEFGMSHQDRTSDIVVNHQAIKQVVDWLFTSALFAGKRARGNAKWKPRMLAVAALLWATSDSLNLKQRFQQARKIVKKIFRWQLPPGATYQGFVKMLRKWHSRLMLIVVPPNTPWPSTKTSAR